MAAEGGGLIPPIKQHNATLRKDMQQMFEALCIIVEVFLSALLVLAIILPLSSFFEKIGKEMEAEDKDENERT